MCREVNRELGRLWRSLDPPAKQKYTSPPVKAKKPITSGRKKAPRNGFDVFMRDYFKETDGKAFLASSREAYRAGGKIWKAMDQSEKERYNKIYYTEKKAWCLENNNPP